jgi:AcrR family transcriptional regulator
VLDAAVRLFAPRGVDPVSLRDIAAAADVKLSLIGRYIGNRETLLRVVEHLSRKLAQDVDNPLSGQGFEPHIVMGQSVRVAGALVITGRGLDRGTGCSIRSTTPAQGVLLGSKSSAGRLAVRWDPPSSNYQRETTVDFRPYVRPAACLRWVVAHYRTSVHTGWQPETAFAFMADLRNFALWDPGVRDVRMDAGEAPGPGAAFDVAVRVPLGTMTLRYEVITWEPPGRLVVRAETSSLTSLDEILVEPTPDGAMVTYDAVLRSRGVLRFANPVLGVVLGRIGDRAAAGLRRVLAADSPPAS